MLSYPCRLTSLSVFRLPQTVTKWATHIAGYPVVETEQVLEEDAGGAGVAVLGAAGVLPDHLAQLHDLRRDVAVGGAAPRCRQRPFLWAAAGQAAQISCVVVRLRPVVCQWCCVRPACPCVG